MSPPGAVDGSGAPAPVGDGDLIGLAAPAVLERAGDYVHLERLRRMRRHGQVLAADVEGREDRYACSVEVRREADRLVLRPTCSCPSRRPFCAHVLAVLILWGRMPAAFVPLEPGRLALAVRPAADLAALLVGCALGGADPLDVVQAAGRDVDWGGQPAGRCLEAWDAFEASSREAGHWPEAALNLAVRIAGAPGTPAADRDARAAVASRHLAWWLVRAAAVLPAPALRPWTRHLAARLQLAQTITDAGALPPALAVWLARMAVALPAEVAEERRWFSAFTAGVSTLAGVFEAELQRIFWAAAVAQRVGASPAAVARAEACAQALAVFHAEAGPGRVAGPPIVTPGRI